MWWNTHRWLAVVPLLVISTTAFAQQPATSAPAPRVVQIPSSGVDALREARAAEAELERIEAGLPTASELEPDASAIEKLAHRLGERAANARARIDATRRAGHLADISYRWQHDHTAAQSILGSLRERAESLGAQRKRIEEIHSRWTTIDEELKDRDVVSEVPQRIGEVLRRAREVREAARAIEAKLLDQQVRGTEVLETIDGVLGAVVAAKPSLSNVLAQGEPIWALPLSRADAVPTLQTMRTDASLARELAGDARGTFMALTLAFVVMAIAFGRVRKRDHEPAALRSAPIACAVVLTVVAVNLLLVAIPSGVQIALDVVATLAALRLIGFFFAPHAAFAARWALLFIVVDVVRHVSHGWPLPDRIGVVAVMALVALLAHTGYRQYVGATGEPRPWARWASVGLLSLAVGALLAAVFGLEVAAELAAAGAVRGARLACLAYVTYRVAVAAVSALLDTDVARKLALVREHRELVLRRIRLVLAVAAAAGWAWAELDLLAAREVATASWQGLMEHHFEIGSLKIGVSQIVLLVVGIAVAVGAARLTRFLLEIEVLPRVPMSVGAQHAAATTASYSMLAIAFLVVLASVGFELGQLAFLAGALGVGIGFGLQNIVNNFVSGLILLFGRPVEMGDTIMVGTVTGEVRRIGFRSSTLRTLEGAEVIVPNSELISNSVTNWTLSDNERRVDVPVGVAYGSDVRRVREVLLAAAYEPEHALKTPPCDVVFVGFGESSLDFVVRVWFRFDQHVAGRSELCFAISAALENAGIAIPFPQRDLHLRSIDAPAAEHLGR